MEDIRSWIEQSPYAQFLGVRLDHLEIDVHFVQFDEAA